MHVQAPLPKPLYSQSEPHDGDLTQGVCVVPLQKVLDGLGRGRLVVECVRRRFADEHVSSRQVYLNPGADDDRLLGSRVAKRCEYSVAVTEITVGLKTTTWLDTLGSIAGSITARVFWGCVFGAVILAVPNPYIAVCLAVIVGLGCIGLLLASMSRSPVKIFRFYVCNHLASSVLVERSCSDPDDAERIVDQFFVRHSEMAIPDHFAKSLLVGTRAFVRWALEDRGFWEGSTSGLAGLGSVPDE